MNRRKGLKWVLPSVFLLLFLTTIFFSSTISVILSKFLPHKEIFSERTPLIEIALSHILLVIAATGFSLVVAFGAAMLTRVPKFHNLKGFLLSIATFSQTIPTIALLALLVPLLGYGFKPILFALFLYGVLPILRNTLEGLETVPADITESARGMGMNTIQILFLVELPMAREAILAGLRTSIILNISVATIGGAVGVNGFGTLIINGIRADDAVLLLKGAMPVSLLALFVDSLFSLWSTKNREMD